MTLQQLDDAERLCLNRLLEPYLFPGWRSSWQIEDAWITARRVGNRSGIPADATTWQYRITFEPGAWAVTVRAVWRGNELHRPLRTHVVVTGYHDDEDLHGRAGVAAHFGDWLRSLHLLVEL